MATHGMMERMKGAALLDVATFEEVEHDHSATLQAAGVVALVTVAEAIGGIDGGSAGIIAGVLRPLGAWLVWAGITYLIGAKIFGGTATWGELLRTLGFAQSPGVLAVFAILPLVGWLVQAVLFLWMLWAGVIAVRQALDFGTGKALLTVFVGWLVVSLPAFVTLFY